GRQLRPEPAERVLGGPAPEERAGVHARGCMALVEDLVAAARVVLAAEEVVEADLVQRRGARVRRNVTADTDARTLRPVDEHRGVPSDVRPDPAFHVLVAREPRLGLGRDGVDVIGRGERRYTDLTLPGALEEPQPQLAGALT